MANKSDIVREIDMAYNKCTIEIAGKMEDLSMNIMEIMLDNLSDLTPEALDRCWTIICKSMDTAVVLRENARNRL